MTDSPRHLKHLDERLAAGLKRDRALRWVVVLIAVFAMAMSGAGLVLVAHRSNNNASKIEKVEPRVAASEDKATDAKTEASATKKTAQEARRSTKRVVRYLQGKAGIPGVPGKNGVKGAPGPPGARGADGRPPTQAEIADAVAAYCASGACKPPGVSRDDVLAAVTSYCAERTCRGPAGSDGKDGKDGANGAQGAQGSPGADGAPPPQYFQLRYGDFVADCVQTDPVLRTYTCTSPPIPSP